ncbi:hypothetical protein [Clostridium botulinum]|uniref:hypothetical protein n=1 Tax=Clostridium botulinum TaxID=1491 RepID=UPI000653217F|nr:hypothetical protein [Clostridium botulinum]QPW60128.1 hypothetical protein IG390_10400 [Clostridium botulinum]
MEKYIFEDENKMFKFDFSNSLWAIDNLNTIYNNTVASILSDVDFIVETEEDIIFIEYKNSDIAGARNPDAFKEKIKKDSHYISIAKKYYGSLLYILGCEKEKNFKFVYILECKSADTVLRKFIRNKIQLKLPFKLQKCSEIKKQLISEFNILSIDEWNTHPKYGKFPISTI